MTGASSRRPEPDPDAPPPPPFDRRLGPFEEARLRRLWARGHDAYRIATLLRLRYSRVEELVASLQGSEDR